MQLRKLTLKARRGSTLVLVGIMAVGFVAVGAIAADIGRYYSVATELQTAADAAAHRGAVKLMWTSGSNPEPVIDTAVQTWVAGTNRADAQALSVTLDKVVMAYYTPGTNGAQGTITTILNGKRPNAVRVTLASAPRGFFANFLGRTDSVAMTRTATAWVASLGSNCVRPWSFPYPALYKAVEQVSTAPTPAPDLDATKFSNYIQGSASTRYFTVVSPDNSTAPGVPANDGEWTGFNFTGNAGRADFQSGIEGCWDDKINPDAGQGVTIPGGADYANWSCDAITYRAGAKGGGSADCSKPSTLGTNNGLCEFSAGSADCVGSPASATPGSTGITINSAWGEKLGTGSNAIDFDYVGEFQLMCFYRSSGDVCSNAEPGTPNTGYPSGTIVGYIKTLKSRYITPDDILGNFTSNVQVIKLVQ